MGWVYVKEMFILIMLTFFVGKMFSFLHDWDFRCFYPCGINLSHIPVPARGKDKKRTVVRVHCVGCLYLDALQTTFGYGSKILQI